MTTANTGRMPVAFTAHGNPMNALGETPFAEFLSTWGEDLPAPRAILCVSAHWECPKLAVTSSERPETIHDFYGFPEALYRLRYPAPGSSEVAGRVRALLRDAGLDCAADPMRGLDHGAWAPLRHIYPAASVPVLELSLPFGAPLPSLPRIGRAVSPLRHEGVLILGSGNLVHNLSTADLQHRDLPVPNWASEFDAWMRARLLARDLSALAAPWGRGPDGRHAHPTLEHYAPLLVCCGAAGPHSAVSFPFEGFEHGTISMRCVRLG
jgi:4,5-DOPA dioxygenase extradiol